jgi:hypothetical protein
MSGGGRKLGSSNFLNQQRLAEACVANEVIARISLRWKMSVLYSIDTGARSFAELKRVHPTLSDHILAARAAARRPHLQGRAVKPSSFLCHDEQGLVPAGDRSRPVRLERRGALRLAVISSAARGL